MRNLFIFFCSISGALADEFAGKLNLNSPIWGAGRIENINKYEGGFAQLFVEMQSGGYFAYLAAFMVGGAIFAFLLHYLIIGAKHFSHEGQAIFCFNKFLRLMHFLAAISWALLVPTGIIMMFGEFFGGGVFVRVCKNLHGIATVIFAITLLPLFFAWFKRMLPAIYDIKWLMIMGGYLNKTKRPIPAGMFNAGQKMWFWVAIGGGFIMILSGAALFFLDFNLPFINKFFGISQIELLRLLAIVHNVLGAICATFLLVHVYMAVFAIKGAIYSMIHGAKSEEEVYILHHYWYQELLKKGKIKRSNYEKSYENLK